MRKVPMRKCVVTQERFPKKELVRIVRTPENTIEIDEIGKKNGHGAYIRMSKETVEKARKTKALDRALEMDIPEEIFDQLENMIHE